MRLLVMAEAFKIRVSEQASRLASALAFGGIGLLVALFGLFFVSVAAMLGLATVWPLHWAALAVGGMLLLIAGILFMLAGGTRKRSTPEAASPPPPPGGQNPELTQALRMAETLARQHPTAATLGAIGLGVLVGLFTGGKKPEGDSCD